MFGLVTMVLPLLGRRHSDDDDDIDHDDDHDDHNDHDDNDDHRDHNDHDDPDDHHYHHDDHDDDNVDFADLYLWHSPSHESAEGNPQNTHQMRMTFCESTFRTQNTEHRTHRIHI